MSRDIAPLELLISDELKEYLLQQANNNKRSLNDEIVERLEKTVLQDECYCGGFGLLLDGYQDLDRAYDDLQTQLNHHACDQSVNLQKSLDELHQKIDALLSTSGRN